MSSAGNTTAGKQFQEITRHSFKKKTNVYLGVLYSAVGKRNPRTPDINCCEIFFIHDPLKQKNVDKKYENY